MIQEDYQGGFLVKNGYHTNGYQPYNPVSENFNKDLNTGVADVTRTSKYIGAMRGNKPCEVIINDQLMEPALLKDDVATITPATIDKIKVGDFVFFRQGNKMVARRVIKRVIEPGEIYLITKQESSKTPDKRLRASTIVGKVSKLVRKGKETRVPNRASFIDELSAFGTIPFGKVVLKFFAIFIPFLHVDDGLGTTKK